MNFIVNALDPELLESLSRDGMAKPNACFANCFAIVALFGKSREIALIMCWLTDQFGVEHAHAVFRVAGKYYDPTIQANPKALAYARSYRVARALSRAEAVQLFEAAGGVIGADGVEGVAPALMPDGSVRCEEVLSP